MTSYNTNTNGVLSSFIYTLDLAGNRTQMAESVVPAGGGMAQNATTVYTYDDTNRLTAEQRTGANPYHYKYAYDGSGNRLAVKDGSDVTLKSYTYDDGNKLLTETEGATTTTYAYDTNGNMTTKTVGTNTTTYTWNADDKMVSFDDGITELAFATDAKGFRRKKGTTTYLYDLAASQTPGTAPILSEYDATGALTTKYTNAGGLTAQTRSGVSHWYMPDALGSVRQLTDSSQNVTDTYVTDAWGGEVATAGTTTNPCRYVGRLNYYTDPETSLMLLGVRYLNASAGRFITLDPIGLEGEDLNLYRYVKNAPVGTFDPEGTISQPKQTQKNKWMKQCTNACNASHPKNKKCCTNYCHARLNNANGLLPQPPYDSSGYAWYLRNHCTTSTPQPTSKAKLYTCAKETACTLIGTLAVCTLAMGPIDEAAIIGCILTGPGWPACVIACLEGIETICVLTALAAALADFTACMSGRCPSTPCLDAVGNIFRGSRRKH